MLGTALLAGGTALVNGIIGGFNNRRANHAQSVENAKQREWQTAENEKTREYNRMLAHQQNQWNIEQWNRENAYNSPAAQMKRFAAAGLNPNAVLGNMSNGPQISGSLTAGAPATPTQGQFDSSIGHRMSSQFDRVKLDPFMMEQLRSMKLDNEMKEIERNDMLRETRADNEANDALIENWDEFITNPIETYYKYNHHYPPNKVLSKLYKIANDYKLAQNLSEEQRERIFYNGLNSETKKYVVSRLAAETKYSQAQADNAFTLFSQQALGVKAQTSMAIKADEFFTVEKILQLGDQAVSIIANGFNAVYGGKLTTVTEHLGPKGYSYTRSSSSRK